MGTNDTLLPLGSVIELARGNQVMIIGYYPCDESSVYRYLATPYPYGLGADHAVVMINEEAIRKTVFRGFMTDESSAFLNKLTALA